MGKPLYLPVIAEDDDFSSWTVIHKFGPSTSASGIFYETLRMQVPDTGKIQTPFSGLLSVVPYYYDANIPLTSLANFAPQQSLPPDPLTLYIKQPFSLTNSTSLAKKVNEIPGGLLSIALIHVDPLALRDAIDDILQRELDILANFDILAIFSDSSQPDVTKDTVFNAFLNGISLPVRGGQDLGQPALDSVSNQRELEIAALTQAGAIDIGFVYDTLRDFIEGGVTALNSFLTQVGINFPVITFPTKAEAIQATVDNILPMGVLESIRLRYNLKPDEWRQVGDNQKKLYLAELLQRSGHATQSIAPAFRFRNGDAKNLFQLEAIVEYYINHNDPWEPATTPIASTDPAYQNVDFLDPAGEAATVSGSVVTLDTSFDTSRITPSTSTDQHDTIELTSDTNPNRKKIYRIKSVSVDAPTNAIKVEVFDTPQVSGTTAWRIHLRPNLVVIDPFGPRLSGDKATVVSTTPVDVGVPHQSYVYTQAANGKVTAAKGAASTITVKGAVIELAEPTPDLSKVNKLFDTLYLPDETTVPGHGARPWKSFRIIDVDNDNHRVTIDITDLPPGKTLPELENNHSRWGIQAGVGGDLPPQFYNLGYNNTLGWNHFDGILFVVHHNRVYEGFRWTSYTSRGYSRTHQFSSSLRGNKLYKYASYTNRNAKNVRRNYSFRVTDATGAGFSNDGVKDARFYFNTPVQADQFTETSNTAQKSLGKTEIRLHVTGVGTSTKVQKKTWSAGCMVSAKYEDFRSLLIKIHQDELQAFDGSRDNHIAVLQNVTYARSKQLWQANTPTVAQWKDKLKGSIWVIRPDERPEGNMGRTS